MSWPVVGDIVHYGEPDGHGGAVCRAAIVAEVHSELCVDLHVLRLPRFGDAGVDFIRIVDRSPTLAPGRWTTRE